MITILSISRPLYDEQGRFLMSNKDICDCLREGCPGCFFPCRQCNSAKCGLKCRCNREWYYQSVEIEGTSLVRQLDIDHKEKL